MSSEEETTKLFRIWKTTLEMLRDRGFLVLDSEINMSMREFLDRFGEYFKRENLDMFMTKKDDPKDQIWVSMAAKKVDALEECLEGEMSQIKVMVADRISSMEDKFSDLQEMVKKIWDLQNQTVASEARVPIGRNTNSKNRRDEKLVVKDFMSVSQIFVFFPNEPKLTIKVAKRYAERMRVENVLRGIIVAKVAPTPIAKSAIEDLSHKYYIEDAELLVNVNNHMLVPKHEALSNEEKKELLKRYTVKETQVLALRESSHPLSHPSICPPNLRFATFSKYQEALDPNYEWIDTVLQLPKMLSSDPIAKYLGIRRGQVVKITRDSETAGKYITYRFVI
ncbi:hypothetical protein M5K25_025171 [Dendrobium thyrsiflorum]|uniref:DNA-directed RNA polymerases I, II, and III subunit RPABC1 n=1 Tax=Dendrobium thyrsiflorum TaxID=117978 RepID=A0ABD0U8Y9_DENTH